MNPSTPERWERIKQLFDESLRLPPEQRAAFINQQCQEDLALAEEVLDLLSHHDHGGNDAGFTADGIPALTGLPTESTTTAERAPLPERIGDYRVVRLLGEGGMGIVYLAEREHPFHQTVAIKVIKPGMDSREVIARFESERQALALMNHPSVAAVHDAGMSDDRRPYFVMEYVPGEPITSFCDRHNYTTRQRLELFVQACEAIQHAHTKAIIHRDLKPTNLLVTMQGDKPLLKVIDFGIAKATAQRLTERTLFTERGQLIGTPEYMSPEQAEMNALDVDTRTDIYSLGVVLYELLTGALPFDSKSLRQVAYGEIQRIVREVDPPRPSTRLSRLGPKGLLIAKHRHTQVAALERELRGELEWIPLKAMRKDRSQRYRTPAELAQDVQNYLAGQALIAGPESARYRVAKLVRRNRVPFAAAAAVLAALVAGLTLATVGLVQAKRQTAIAQANAARADREAARVRAEAVHRAEVGHSLWQLADALGQTQTSQPAKVEQVLDDALATFERAAHDYPDEPFYRQELAYTHRKLGWFLQRARRFPEAETHLRAAIEIYTALARPDTANSFMAQEAAYTGFFWGEHLRRSGRVKEAAAEYRQTAAMAQTSASRFPQNPMPWQILGWARYQTGDWQGCIVAMEKSISVQTDPPGGDPYQWFHLSMAHWQLGHREEARIWYDKAVGFIEAKGWYQGDIRSFRAETESLLAIGTAPASTGATTAPVGAGGSSGNK